MTVIAWDGKTLAADRMSVNNGVPNTVRKIFRVRDTLCGFSGDLTFGVHMLEWWRNGGLPGEYPASQRTKEDWNPFIVIQPEGYVWRFEQSPYPIIFKDKMYAIGSGRDFALMAMYLGKTSKEAVQLTCKLIVDCGLGIDTLEL